MKLIVTADQAKALARLRCPSARRAYLRFPFAREGYTNSGYTLQFQAGEPAVAAGDGTVVSVQRKPPTYPHATGEFDTFFPYEVVIDHGFGIQTVLSGMRSTELQSGRTIGRGDLVGPLATDECFLGVRINNNWVNPSDISRHFVPMLDQQVPGQGHKLRFGPDTILRNLANGIVALFYTGLHYFTGTTRYLVNVDFNGSGSKTGLAADGFTASDYWNVYPGGAFSITNSSGYYYYYYYYCTGLVFSSNPQTFLLDQDGVKTAVWLERVASATGDSGSGSRFDDMLGTWIGDTGVENFFALKGVPAGTYDLYLYAQAGNSTFYVALNESTPTVKSLTYLPLTAFVEDQNYVRYTLVVPSGSFISVKAYGFLAGLQLVKQ